MYYMIYTEIVFLTSRNMLGDCQSAPKSKLYQRPGLINRIAGFLAITLALTSVIMLIVLALGNESKGYLGGLNWTVYTFNWHPIMMVSGLVFCSITAILSYRLVPIPKAWTKLIHGFLHSCGIVCLSIGLSAIFISNNYRNKNITDVYYPDLFSLHSFVGIGALILYGGNYVLGFFHYVMPMPLHFKERYMPTHVFIGSFAFFAAIMAALTGLMELATEYNCQPTQDTADLDTSKQYLTMNSGCRLMNSTALVLFATAFCAALAIWENHAHNTRMEKEKEKGTAGALHIAGMSKEHSVESTLSPISGISSLTDESSTSLSTGQRSSEIGLTPYPNDFA